MRCLKIFIVLFFPLCVFGSFCVPKCEESLSKYHYKQGKVAFKQAKKICRNIEKRYQERMKKSFELTAVSFFLAGEKTYCEYIDRLLNMMRGFRLYEIKEWSDIKSFFYIAKQHFLLAESFETDISIPQQKMFLFELFPEIEAKVH